MNTKTAIDEFNHWAEIGKDVGMEEGHNPSVSRMVEILGERYETQDIETMLDLGCGNGWMLRKIKNKFIIHTALGVDGAEQMIDNAKKIDSNSSYLCTDISTWIPNQKFDLIMSMEFIYYLENPADVFERIFQVAADQNTIFIIGIDHYKENKDSLSWPEDLNVKMKTLGINEWIDLYASCGLKNIYYEQYGATEKSEGTLIITGVK
jgi:predicted TPR repeat methyltransferase